MNILELPLLGVTDCSAVPAQGAPHNNNEAAKGQGWDEQPELRVGTADIC